MRLFFLFLMASLMLVGGAAAQHVPQHRTILLHDPDLGTRIIFLGSWNNTYLWHPSTNQVVAGRWSERETDDGRDRICLRYGESEYNPLTGLVGGNPECVNPIELHSRTVESIDGDLFGLADRATVPFQLSARRTTLAALADKAGIPMRGEIDVPIGIIRPGEGAPSIEQICATLRNRDIPQNQELCAEYW